MDIAKTRLILAEYAEAWGVTLPEPLRIVPRNRWFRCVEHRVFHESEHCVGLASIEIGRSHPTFSDFRPRNGNTGMFPPWAAYPQYSSVSGGWRQGYGDGYLFHWLQWLGSLAAHDRKAYLSQYPAPSDDRLWDDWFQWAVIPTLPEYSG